jgi:beta-lactamase class A
MKKAKLLFGICLFICFIVLGGIGWKHFVGDPIQTVMNNSVGLSFEDEEQVNSENGTDAVTAVTESATIQEYKVLKKAAQLEAERLRNQEMEKLKQGITNILGSNINNVGIAFYDIKSKSSFDINGDKIFTAASTVKVPVAMATAELIQDGKLSLNSTIAFKDSDYEEGAGILVGSSKLNAPITISDLIKYSLIYSDNIAVNMLLRTITNNERYDFIEEVVGHPVDRKANLTTAKDSMLILKKLYENKENNSTYDIILSHMKKTIYHDRIDKYIPREIVAHKIGDYGNYANDIAIVYDSKPYIITVFTKNLNEDAYEIIAKISKYIYNNRGNI